MYKCMFMYMCMYAMYACKCRVTERTRKVVRLSALRGGQVELFVVPNCAASGLKNIDFPPSI